MAFYLSAPLDSFLLFTSSSPSPASTCRRWVRARQSIYCLEDELAPSCYTRRMRYREDLVMVESPVVNVVVVSLSLSRFLSMEKSGKFFTPDRAASATAPPL